MKRSSNLALILFFTLLTFVMTTLVVVTWEWTLRDPIFALVERKYPGEENRQKLPVIQQRVEHFIISITVDVVVVTLLLRLINRKQRALLESEERYRALFEHAGDGIGVVTAADHRLAEVNNRFCQIVGDAAQGLVGRDVRDLIKPLPGGDGPAFDTLLDGREDGEVELVVETTSGAALPVAVSFNTLDTARERLIILIIRDLSTRRRLEAEREQMRQQLFQTAKLASLGELSAGVAHEINNPLNGIINFAQLLKDDGHGHTEFERQMIDGILDEGGRIAGIVRGLLTFARHDTNRFGSVPLAEIVSSSLALFGRQFEKDGIRVETEIPEDLPPLRADASRLRQVVVNMLSNAHHALKAKQSDSKVFRISARGVERGGRRLVRMEFYDNGVGIRVEDIERVFDPFFTTRRDSGGTGLGLSISFGIIRDHGGTITVEGAEGQFARFIVELPAYEPAEEA